MHVSSLFNRERHSMVRDKRNKIEPQNQMSSSSPGTFKNSQYVHLCKKSIGTDQELLAVTRKMANLQLELHQLKKSYALVELLLEEQTKSLVALREEQPAWEGCYFVLESVLQIFLRELDQLQKTPSCDYVITHHITADDSQYCITEN